MAFQFAQILFCGRLLSRIALQFAQVLFCPFTAGTAERQTEYEGLLPQSSDRSFRQLGNSLRRRLFTRMVLQFAQILFFPFTAANVDFTPPYACTLGGPP